MRRVASLAFPAFLASAASTQSLQATILPSHISHSDPFYQSYKNRWSTTFGPVPTGDTSGKQSAWDRPGLLAVPESIQQSKTDPLQRAAFLAATTRHSGDWLSALPIASCGLRLDNDAVRVAVASRLGMALCAAHVCRCGSQVDTWGVHALVCKTAPSRIIRHHALNDIIARAFASAKIPATKEPSGLSRGNGKRPDGVTLIPWQRGFSLTWDVTVATTLADSYVHASAASAGAAAELAASRKQTKYATLSGAYMFQPIAVETLGPINDSAVQFLQELGRRMSSVSQDDKEGHFLFQRLSVVLQRFNAILLHGSFVVDDDPDV